MCFRVVEIPPIEKLGPNEVKVKMLRAPINPADVNVVEGKYGILPDKFPAVGGNEGVGVVEEVGAGKSDFQKGDLVVPSSPLLGVYRFLFFNFTPYNDSFNQSTLC